MFITHILLEFEFKRFWTQGCVIPHWMTSKKTLYSKLLKLINTVRMIIYTRRYVYRNRCLKSVTQPIKTTINFKKIVRHEWQEFDCKIVHKTRQLPYFRMSCLYKNHCMVKYTIQYNLAFCKIPKFYVNLSFAVCADNEQTNVHCSAVFHF